MQSSGIDRRGGVRVSSFTLPTIPTLALLPSRPCDGSEASLEDRGKIWFGGKMVQVSPRLFITKIQSHS